MSVLMFQVGYYTTPQFFSRTKDSVNSKYQRNFVKVGIGRFKVFDKPSQFV